MEVTSQVIFKDKGNDHWLKIVSTVYKGFYCDHPSALDPLLDWKPTSDFFHKQAGQSI